MLDQVVIITGVTLLVMISPGPDMVLVLRNTVVAGRSAGLGTSLGILAGNLVHITYCVVGIGWLISQSIVAFTVLKYAGAAYLFFLGISSLRATTQSLDTRNLDKPDTSRTWFLQGFFNNILNPKGTLFYLGVFTMVITPGTPQLTTAILILVMVFISASFWLFFVMTLDRPIVRRFIARSQVMINRLFGALLITLSIRVALMAR